MIDENKEEETEEIESDESETSEKPQKPPSYTRASDPYEELSTDDLKEQLKKAIDEEAYEKASRNTGRTQQTQTILSPPPVPILRPLLLSFFVLCGTAVFAQDSLQHVLPAVQDTVTAATVAPTPLPSPALSATAQDGIHGINRFHGLIGIAFILLIAFLFSNNKRRINLRLRIVRLALQAVDCRTHFAGKLRCVPFLSVLGKGMQKNRTVCQGRRKLPCTAALPSWATTARPRLYRPARVRVCVLNVTDHHYSGMRIVAVFYHIERYAACGRGRNRQGGMNLHHARKRRRSLEQCGQCLCRPSGSLLMIRPYLKGMTKANCPGFP